MEIILTQDVDSLGLTGQVVNVAKGFARNKLIPSGMAVLATPGNLKRLEKQRAEYEIRAKKAKDRASDLATRIAGIVVTIERKAGDKGKLYGSVTSMDIGQALADQDVEIDRRKIKLAEPIKALGDHDVPIRLHSDVTAVLKVSVQPAEE